MWNYLIFIAAIYSIHSESLVFVGYFLNTKSDVYVRLGLQVMIVIVTLLHALPNSSIPNISLLRTYLVSDVIDTGRDNTGHARWSSQLRDLSYSLISPKWIEPTVYTHISVSLVSLD